MTFRRRDMIGINEGFFWAGSVAGRWIQEILTVRIDLALQILRPMGLINRGLHSVVTLCFHL